MFPQEPDQPLRDLLLTAWKHNQEGCSDPHYLSHPPNVLCYSASPSGFVAHHDNQSKFQKELLEGCEKYVLNYLPTHLLRISDMSLVTRTDFWDAERPKIESNLQERCKELSHDKQRTGMRDDEVVETDRWDAVRHRPTRFGQATYAHFSSTSVDCSSSPYCHTVGEMKNRCFTRY